MDDKLASELLKSIGTTGSASDVIKVLINQGLDNVVDLSSGLARLRPSAVKHFSLIVGNPLVGFNPTEIRCLSCNRIISYPAWHLKISTLKNQFHYFTCFNGTDKAVFCHRRG